MHSDCESCTAKGECLDGIRVQTEAEFVATVGRPDFPLTNPTFVEVSWVEITTEQLATLLLAVVNVTKSMHIGFATNGVRIGGGNANQEGCANPDLAGVNDIQAPALVSVGWDLVIFNCHQARTINFVSLERIDGMLRLGACNSLQKIQARKLQRVGGTVAIQRFTPGQAVGSVHRCCCVSLLWVA
jgi:hypothetical protein